MRETGQLQLGTSTSDPDNPFLTNPGLLGGGARENPQNVNPPFSDAAEMVYSTGGFRTQGSGSKASGNGGLEVGGREEGGMEGEAADVELADLLNGGGKRSVETEGASLAAEQNKRAQERQMDPEKLGAASLFQTEGASEGSDSKRLDQWLNDRLQGPEESEWGDEFWARLQEGAGRKGVGLQNEVTTGEKGMREGERKPSFRGLSLDEFWADLKTREDGTGSGLRTEAGEDWEETRKRDGLLTFGMREDFRAGTKTGGTGNECGLQKGLIGEEGECRKRDEFFASSRTSQVRDENKERIFFGEGLRSTSPARSWPFMPQVEKGKAGLPDLLVNSVPRETPDGTFEDGKDNGDMNGHNYNGKFLASLEEELLSAISAFGVFCPDRGGYTVMRALDFNTSTRAHKICPFHGDEETEAYWAPLWKTKVRLLNDNDFDPVSGDPPAFIPRGWKRKLGRDGRRQRILRAGGGQQVDQAVTSWEVGSFQRGRSARKMESEDVRVGAGTLNWHPVAAPPSFSPEEHARALETAPRSFRFVFQTEPEPTAQMLHFYSRHLFGIPPEPIEGTDAR